MNSIVWFYDNFRKMQPVNNITLKIKLSEKFNNVSAYPEKMIRNNLNNTTEFIWNFDKLDENQYQQIYLQFPSDNKIKTRKLVKF